jgi:CubicO group peptidase (beta-lactamase class C family)
MGRTLWIGIGMLAALPVAAAGSKADQPSRVDPLRALAGLDRVVQDALADQKIPGAAVAVVVGDRVVLLEGWGFADLEAKRPMTPDTLIPIASITKQFTVAALATLARDGRLDWDAPVRDYLPEFRLHDDFATLRATTRDLVTHRVGLPRHDASWFGSPLTREQLYGRLRHLPFSRDLRESFQYNNLMFMTAGYLGGRLSGGSYEDLVRAALLEPLGMTRTSFSLAALGVDADAAAGYLLDGEKRLVRDPFETAEQMAPTGGLNSTARDLARWLRMLLGGGEIDGRRILLAEDVAEMSRPQTPIGPPFFPEFGFQSYGMGLYVGAYRGHETAGHRGNLPGAAAAVLLVPKERIGVAVLTNRSGAVLRDGLPYEILDRLLGLPSSGLVGRFAEIERKGFADEDEAKAAGATDRVPETAPSHRLEQYAGRYAHPGYGPIDVRLADGALRLEYHGFGARLDHWHYDVFQTPEDRTSRLDRLRVQFATDLAGEISAVDVPLEPAVEPIRFARQPPPEMLDRAFLERFVGTYELFGFGLEVTLRGDGVLVAGWPGTVLELVPLRGTTFRVKERTGLAIEFLSDDAGEVDRIVWHEGGAAIGHRKR